MDMKLLDVVALTLNLPGLNLLKGQVGTLVEVYSVSQSSEVQ